MITASLSLVLALLACSGDEAPKQGKKAKKKEAAEDQEPVVTAPPTAPTAAPSVDLSRSSGAIAWRALDQLQGASLTFPEGASAAAGAGRFVLKGEWADEGERRGGWHAYTFPLPFSTNMPRPNYAPMGAKLLVEGKEVPFNTTIAPPTKGGTSTWFVDRGRVVLLATSNPSTWEAPPEIHAEELAQLLLKREFKGSGLGAVEFAQTSLTIDRITRPGLFLPGGSSATFDVALPAKAELRFGTALLPDPVSGKAAGDGAEVVVSLDGAEVWRGKVDPAQGHTDQKIELAAAAPRTGKLRIETLTGATAAGDDVVLTAPYIRDAAVTAPRRVLVVAFDTLRWDALSSNGSKTPTSPELDAWLAQSVVFDNAYAPAPRTKPSFRTAFTGRKPTSANDAPTLADLLGPQNVSTAGFVGNVHLVPRFGFSRGMDHWDYENGAKARDQVERALSWLEAHQNEDAFMFVHFMDPHTFYDAPDAWKAKFITAKRPPEVPARFNRWQIIELMKKRKLSDEGKTWIKQAYDAEVAYATFQASRLLAAVEAMPGQTLTVLHSDHGEEFWDHNGFEHNHSLYDELVHVPLAVRPPKGWQGAPRVTENVGLVDIVPTVLDFMGLPPESTPPLDGVSLRPLIDASEAAEATALKAALAVRPLLIGHMRYERDRWGVVKGKHKYLLQTWSSKQDLFDLEGDPGETKSLAQDADPALMADMRAALATASGWPVQWGWRLRVPSDVSTTRITFEAPIVGAGLMDPEWNRPVRANLEWGEKPEVPMAEIGTVELSADKKSVVFNPGPQAPGGTIFIQCSADPCPSGKLTMGKISISMAEPGRDAGGTRYSIEKGFVMVPDDSYENPHATTAPATSSELESLESLGYLHGAAEKEGQD